MNANEAISKIRFMLDVGGSDGFTSADKEALNMAINALSEKTTAPPKSNGDRIRQMTDEELAEIVTFEDCFGDDCFGIYCERPGWKQDPDCTCKECFLMWLKQEASEDAGSKID